MRTSAVAPVVGCLADVAIDEGEKVDEGDLVCCVESMKVMFQIYAPAAGVVEYEVELGEMVGEGATVFWVVTEN